jgi:ABC-type transport system involved in multi-copper enzyme maturation permease subunit
VLYVVAVLIILLVSAIGSGMVFLRMATEAGEFETASSISASFVRNTLGMWSSGGMFLALFLGAIGISSEIHAKTIVHVLSRPVERSAYLAGRWLGILSFLTVFQLLGIALALLVAWIFNVGFTPTLWLGLAEILVGIFFLSGVSLSLSVVMPALPAGACAMILSIAPELVGKMTNDPRWYLKAPAYFAYYLGPADMPIDLVGESFSKQALNPDYALYTQVLIENLVYTLVVFTLAAALFSRKELRLR